jgi:hypothetical protein
MFLFMNIYISMCIYIFTIYVCIGSTGCDKGSLKIDIGRISRNRNNKHDPSNVDMFGQPLNQQQQQVQ